MSDTSKSGFQLRFDLLCLAKDILAEESERNAKHISEDEGSTADSPEISSRSIARSEAPSVTTADVLREAEKLYGFVQKKG